MIDECFDVKVNKENIEWYRCKGYDCELRDIINVNVFEFDHLLDDKYKYCNVLG